MSGKHYAMLRSDVSEILQMAKVTRKIFVQRIAECDGSLDRYRGDPVSCRSKQQWRILKGSLNGPALMEPPESAFIRLDVKSDGRTPDDASSNIWYLSAMTHASEGETTPGASSMTQRLLGATRRRRTWAPAREGQSSFAQDQCSRAAAVSLGCGSYTVGQSNVGYH